MPLPMIHLCVAVKLNIPIIKSGEFYLGNISPDAVHTRIGYVSEDKTISHCNARKIENIGELDALCDLIRGSDGGKREFLIGYLIHILTDIYWSDSVLLTFKDRYYDDPSPIQDRRMAYYNDTDQLDFEFYNNLDWRVSVWDMLTQAQGFSVEGAVSREEVTMLRDRTVKWYSGGQSQHTNPVKYITYDELERFTDSAAQRCEEHLIDKKLFNIEIV